MRQHEVKQKIVPNTIQGELFRISLKHSPRAHAIENEHVVSLSSLKTEPGTGDHAFTPVHASLAVGRPDGRQVQEAVSHEEGVGDRLVDARVEAFGQRGQDRHPVLQGNQTVR